MKLTSDIVLKLLGVLRFARVDLKSWRLLKELVANKDSFVNAFIETTKKMEISYAII